MPQYGIEVIVPAASFNEEKESIQLWQEQELKQMGAVYKLQFDHDRCCTPHEPYIITHIHAYAYAYTHSDRGADANTNT